MTRRSKFCRQSFGKRTGRIPWSHLFLSLFPCAGIRLSSAQKAEIHLCPEPLAQWTPFLSKTPSLLTELSGPKRSKLETTCRATRSTTAQKMLQVHALQVQALACKWARGFVNASRDLPRRRLQEETAAAWEDDESPSGFRHTERLRSGLRGEEAVKVNLPALWARLAPAVIWQIPLSSVKM